MKKITKKDLGKKIKFKTKKIKKIFGDKNVLLSIDWFRFDIKIIKNKSNFILKTKEKNQNFDLEKEKNRIKKYKKEIKKTGELRLSFPIRRKDIRTFSNLYSFKIKGVENDKLVLFKIKKKPKIKGEYEEVENFEGPLFGSRNREEKVESDKTFGRSYRDEELEGSCLFGRFKED